MGGPSKNFKFITSLSKRTPSPTVGTSAAAGRASTSVNLNKTTGTVVKKALQNRMTRMMINDSRRSNILQYEEEV